MVMSLPVNLRSQSGFPPFGFSPHLSYADIPKVANPFDVIKIKCYFGKIYDDTYI
jgi:hypothetical protein